MIEGMLLALWLASKEYRVSYMQINSNTRWRAYIFKLCESKFGTSWQALEYYYRGEKKANPYSSYSAKFCNILYRANKCGRIKR